MTMFLAPYTAIADIDGSPLDAGFLFFGEYGKDPELFPVEVFWDSDFTVPAAQPIRTRNGYPVRNGSPTKVYLKTAQHSIVIKNRNSAFILVDFKNKGWDASFVTYNGQSQEKINDGLASIYEMIGIPNPKNGMRVFVKGLQGGWFEYNSSKASVNDGIMVFNGWVRITLETVIYPEWAGAIGDEVADDTVAFKVALNFISSTVWDTSIAVMNQRGGGGVLRLNPKKYRITDTLWIGAYTQIVGSTELGFNSNNIDLASCIVADFDDPLKPAISSSNFKAGGVRTAFNEMTNGAMYDNGNISGTHGIGLLDFSVITASGKRGFMGVRLQNSPQSKVRLYTKGFDYGIMANACWQSKFDCRSLSYKCGLYLRSDNNACIVDGYWNSLSDNTPLNTTNLITFFDAGTDTDTTLNELNKQFGFVSFGSFGLTGTAIVTELNDVGTVVCMGLANIQTLYTEKNRVTGYCAYTNYSPVIIGNFVGAADQTCMLLGANSKTRILASRKTSTVGDYFSKLSRYNTELYVPQSFDGTYIRGIQYDNDQRILYVNASTGSNKNTGLLSNLPLLTLDEALARIITYSVADKNVTQPQKMPYTIILAAGSYSVSAIKNLYCDVHITTTETTNFPTLTFTSHINLNESSNLTLSNINVIKPDVTGLNENACVWSVTGKNSFTINGGATQILKGGLVYPDYNGCSEVSLILNKATVTGTADSQLVQTNYTNFAPHIVNVVRAGGSIDAAISGRSDKGVSVPTAWQGKILGL
ncbi:hypothetical protein [Acinetobacter sp. YH12140]|uniref:hypothetical protein n=1 Tax=Acinetobacter sp. YH12140 TaxID=2601124 RepID=UPI0015D180C8|nr:hypothetical protein [Acinetobacter sp. YH12140]